MGLEAHAYANTGLLPLFIVSLLHSPAFCLCLYCLSTINVYCCCLCIYTMFQEPLFSGSAIVTQQRDSCLVVASRSCREMGFSTEGGRLKDWKTSVMLRFPSSSFPSSSFPSSCFPSSSGGGGSGGGVGGVVEAGEKAAKKAKKEMKKAKKAKKEKKKKRKRAGEEDDEDNEDNENDDEEQGGEEEGASGAVVPWTVYPGLFAGGGMDVMTSFMLKVMATLPPPPPRSRVLDFCRYEIYKR